MWGCVQWLRLPCSVWFAKGGRTHTPLNNIISIRRLRWLKRSTSRFLNACSDSACFSLSLPSIKSVRVYSGISDKDSRHLFTAQDRPTLVQYNGYFAGRNKGRSNPAPNATLAEGHRLRRFQGAHPLLDSKSRRKGDMRRRKRLSRR